MSEKKFYPKWNVVVKKGKIVFEDREGFDVHLIPLEGKEMHIILKDRTTDRSRQEEKYYHAVVVRMIAEEMCVTEQETHEFLKKMFLTVEEKSNNGYRYERVQSTTELTDKSYREYWKKCQRWAALPTGDEGLGPDSGLNLYIPDPNEVDYSTF